MDIAHTPLIERIARVLAGQRLSSNAEGSNPSAGDVVDLAWREHLDDARAVLKTMREPDQAMVAAGDLATWERMVLAAIGADDGGGANGSVAESAAAVGP